MDNNRIDEIIDSINSLMDIDIDFWISEDDETFNDLTSEEWPDAIKTLGKLRDILINVLEGERNASNRN